MEGQTTNEVPMCFADGDLIHDSEDAAVITFAINKYFKSFGEFRLSVDKKLPTQNAILAQRVTQNRMVEDNSSASSFILVSDHRHISSDKSSSTGNQDVMEAESKALMMKDFLEQFDYVIESKLQNVYFEILRYNVSVDIGSVVCSDIAVTRSGKQLVGLSWEEQNISIFDLDANLVGEIPCDKQYNRLAVLTENEIVLISINDPFVRMINTSTNTVEDLACNCPHPKMTMCAFDHEVYILCAGKHVHIFSGKSWVDVPLQGLEGIVWRPTFAAINRDKTKLFITELALDNVYCFDTSNGELTFCDTCGDSSKGITVCGLFCLDNYVLVVDKHNDCIEIYTAESWLYTDTVEHEAFSACKLVATGTSADELLVVCERKAGRPEEDELAIPVAGVLHNVKRNVVTSTIHGNVGVMSVNKNVREEPKAVQALELYPELEHSGGLKPESQIIDDHRLKISEANVSKFIGNAEMPLLHKASDTGEFIQSNSKTTPSKIVSDFGAKADVVYFLKISLVQSLLTAKLEDE